MNTVIISGRITKDIELKTTNSGISVVRFTVAVRSSRKDADGKAVSDFISCIAWRSTAEFIEKYFSKGKWIEVRGELQTGSYEKTARKYTQLMLLSIRSISATAKKTKPKHFPMLIRMNLRALT